ncbi:hypothetical protein Tco_0089060 [Tanacetum coccineum]
MERWLPLLLLARSRARTSSIPLFVSQAKFGETHNVVAFLEKPKESDGFAEIIDFLKASSVSYALTVNPVIYTSCIEQFWATAKVQTVNGVRQLQALVDKKRVIVTESSIRRDLHLDDAEGTDCLPTATIFEELACMGYEKPSQKLTFYKAFFSPQWKYFIHTITQCLSAKSTTWNEFRFYAYLIHIDKEGEFLKIRGNEESVPTPSNDPQPSGLKRLRKVGMSQRVESSKDQESLGVPEDASKQGRSIADIDADVEVTLVDETQVRQNDDLIFDTGVLDDVEMPVEAKVDGKDEQSTKTDDSTAGEAVTTAGDDSVVPTTNEEITLAQTLIQIKAAKPKVRKDQIALDEQITRDIQAKLDAELLEEQKLARKQEEEANIALIESWENTQDMMNADRLLAERLQSKEREELTDEEKAKLFMELMEKRRKHFAALRAQEKRNRPPTKA